MAKKTKRIEEQVSDAASLEVLAKAGSSAVAIRRENGTRPTISTRVSLVSRSSATSR